jgi:hypothetical protein
MTIESRGCDHKILDVGAGGLGIFEGHVEARPEDLVRPIAAEALVESSLN